MSAELSKSTRDELHALLLADGLPDILEFLNSVCEAEAERFLQQLLEAARAKDFEWESPESKATSKQRFFWLFLFRDAEWVIRGIRETIRHRGMTDKEIDAEHRAEKINRAKKELAQLEAEVGAA
jgi:hypothetical protein